MKKIIKSLFAIVLSLAVLCAGVWSLVAGNLHFGGRITFEAENVFVDIEGEVRHGRDVVGQDYSFVFGAGSAAKPDDWIVGQIGLTIAKPAVTYRFSFTNDGSREIDIKILRPEVLTAAFSFTGGFVTGVSEGGCVYAAAAEVDVSSGLASGETAVFLYTLELKDFSASLEVEINFSVNIFEAGT